jgi:hypothetical protein
MITLEAGTLGALSWAPRRRVSLPEALAQLLERIADLLF